MAYINDVYVHVVNESVNRDVLLTTHPTEIGIDLTDTVKAKALVLSLSGLLANTAELKASEALTKLNSMKNNGTIVNYIGRNVINQLQIASFTTSHPNTVSGGCSFELTLQEARIAQNSFVAPSAPEQAVPPANPKPPETADITVGSVVVFKGGSVYTSSDAAKPAATRGRSTCKVTIVNNNKHGLHLISTDGGKVYGWCDRGNVEMTGGGQTNTQSKAGTQQVSQNR